MTEREYWVLVADSGYITHSAETFEALEEAFRTDGGKGRFVLGRRLAQGRVQSVRVQVPKMPKEKPVRDPYIHPGPHDPRPDRTAAMASAYAIGATLEEIGQEWGVTRERVRQLLGRVGGTKVVGNPLTKALRRNKQWEAFDPNDPRFRYANMTRSAKHILRWHERKPVRREQVRKLREWVAANHNNPTATEVLAIVESPSIASLSWTWGRRKQGLPYIPYIRRLRRLAGCTLESERGHNSHHDPKPAFCNTPEGARERQRQREIAAHWKIEHERDNPSHDEIAAMMGMPRLQSVLGAWTTKYSKKDWHSATTLLLRELGFVRNKWGQKVARLPHRP